jgi:hypothetical protein
MCMNMTHLPCSVVRLSVAAMCAVALFGCANLNDPYFPPGGGFGTGPYYGGSQFGYGDDFYRNQRERERLDRERDRIEQERWRLERERDQQYQRPYQPPPPSRPAPSQDRCPPGFSPSENKCSQDERRRGCRDIRLPSGLGCVSR